jgi:hypothetical protein
MTVRPQGVIIGGDAIAIAPLGVAPLHISDQPALRRLGAREPHIAKGTANGKTRRG